MELDLIMSKFSCISYSNGTGSYYFQIQLYLLFQMELELIMSKFSYISYSNGTGSYNVQIQLYLLFQWNWIL